MKHLESIAKQFRFDGEIIEIKPFGNGHIHDTYRIETAPVNHEKSFGSPKNTMENTGQNKRPSFYILQKINHHVFSDPPKVMENILRVTRHIRQKLEQSSLSQTEILRRVLDVVLTRDGESYYINQPNPIGDSYAPRKASETEYWRSYRFISGAQTHDTIRTPDQLYKIAFAFGQFIEMLSDFPASNLYETIPNFHNGALRFQTFEGVLKNNIMNRISTASPEIEFLLDNRSVFDVLPQLVKEGKIPIRVTHNDTKANNIMIDTKTGEGICVIDLDTVMPGLSLYDFGDLARSTLSITDESETDLSKVSIETPRLEALLNGFIDGTGGNLTPAELEHLIFSAQMMSLLIGMRFLTDYLSGDTYFKIEHPTHNLERARRQFKLAQTISDFLKNK